MTTLKTKMTAVVCLLVAAVLAVTLLTVVWYLEVQFRETVSKQQFGMLKVIAEEIDSRIAMSQRQLVAVAGTVTPQDLSTPERAARFLSLQPDEVAAFDNGISLLAADGRLIATIPPEPDAVGKNFLSREHVKKTVESGKPVISGVARSSRSHRHPKVTFTAPVFHEGKVIGVLCGSHDLMKSNYLGKLAASTVGDGGFLYLLQKDGTVIVHPDSSRVLEAPRPGSDALLDKALAGFQGTGETVDGEGRRLVSSFKRLNSADWIVSANYLQSEAYAPLRQARWYLLSGVLVALCCTVAGSWLFMRRLTAPLVSFIGHVERITGKEHEPEPVTIGTRDEIGTLADAFNRMVQEAHRQKEAALAQEAFSENLLQNSSVATFVLDSLHRVIMWNKACEELTGVPASRVLGTPDAWRAFYPEKRPVLADFVMGDPDGISSYYSSWTPSPLVADGVSAEAWFPEMLGRERFLCFDAAPIRDGEGRVIAAIQTLQDITGRKQAEESLKKLSLAIEQMPVTVMITGRDGIIEYVNPHFTKVTGYRPDEAIGRMPNIVRSGWHPPEFYQELWSTILSGREWRGELRNRRKEGEMYWESVSISFVKDPSGEIRHFVVVGEDISERKRAEEALRGKDEHIRLLLESTAEAIYGIDMSGACTFANPACAELLGFAAADDLLGQNMHQLIHHTRADGAPYPQSHCPLCRVLRGEGGVHINDEIFWRRDGSFFAVEYWSYPQLRDGEVVGGVVTFFDITERKRAEEEVRRASAAAEAAARAKSDFLANMSHEIRTPLNAALGMLYLLRQTPLSERQKGYLDKAQTASTMLLRLINDILDFSKIEAGKLELEKVPFRLGVVLNDLSTVAAAMLQNDRIELSVRTLPEVPDSLVGDPLRLSQILLNLTSNAIKFTEHGRIEVEVGVDDCNDREATLRFSVADSGIGIPADKQATLFSAFTQADSSTTRRYGGTGLGLTISQDLVHLMGGAISVTSRQGEGSTFTFTVPFLRQSVEQVPMDHGAVEGPGAGGGAGLAGARILLVEDNAINQEVARELLERHGVQVEVANNGAEAVERVKGAGRAFDAVLMDVHMPVMDGLEATRALRRDPALARLPIIAMTASAMAEDREICLKSGMNDQVNKPIAVGELLETLGRWIGREYGADAGSPPPEQRPGTIAPFDLPGGMRSVDSLPLLRRLLRNFRTENAGAGEELRGAIAAGEYEFARRLIHAIKGVAGNLGFTSLCSAAGSLEPALKDPRDLDALQAAVGAFEERLAEVLASIAVLEQEGALDPPEKSLAQTASLYREEVAALAGELSLLLEAHNLNALAVWERMRPLLSGESAEMLEAKLQCLDFEDASRLLQGIMREMEI